MPPMKQYIVDAFVDGPFSGNPAAVVPLESWPTDALMQSIAAENNLSETAYFVPVDETYELRWFTPTAEVSLCGHATLASAHVLLSEVEPSLEVVEFHSKGGRLLVFRSNGGYAMDFPAIPIREASNANAVLSALGLDGEVLDADGSPLVIAVEETAVEQCVPDMARLAELDGEMVVVTAPADDDGRGFDVVTRVFAPSIGIPEDPATGAAHCAITPFWCARLAQSSIRSLQISERTGTFECDLSSSGERVVLKGRCRTFAKGEIVVEF